MLFALRFFSSETCLELSPARSYQACESLNQVIAMKMRSYLDKNSMSETNIGSADSPFSWLYHYNPTSKPGLSSLHRRHEPGLVVSPIRTICSTTESGNKNDWETKITQVGKQKSSVKGSNQIASKVLGPKQPIKKPSVPKKAKGPNIPEAKREKNNLNVDLDRTKFDFSGVPSPICSCTGVARVCYKWGASGWQSSCCTINISECPLPMSPTRPGARVAGRKMSNGAYFKLLLRLGAEGYDLSHPVDLKDHWARHGTNKFVTIK
ncbi:protein BASIC PENTACYSTEINE7-like isoform X2 [Hibiscus syriacus]|uniref:protein BASIC PENTACYSTEINE7-like isoform X2 n=1 Tax=Hibiscus syriacus TaxID=106335 RepID=UPI0019245E8E|nr:protein BASIC PENTACYSTEINE7-like isoform X2 [Hibiscus syriacus]